MQAENSRINTKTADHKDAKPFKNNWYVISILMGLADAAWQVACFAVSDRPDWVTDTNVAYPILIGISALPVNFILQILHFMLREGRCLTSTETGELFVESVALAAKVTAGMAGWELGLLGGNVLADLTSSIDSNPTVYNNTLKIASAIMSGAAQAIGVLLVTLFIDILQCSCCKSNTEDSKTSKTDIACDVASNIIDKVTTFSFTWVAGSAWYMLSLIDLGVQEGNWENKASNALVSGVATFFIVHLVVALIHPISSIKSFYSGVVGLFKIPGACIEKIGGVCAKGPITPPSTREGTPMREEGDTEMKQYGTMENV